MREIQAALNIRYTLVHWTPAMNSNTSQTDPFTWDDTHAEDNQYEEYMSYLHMKITLPSTLEWYYARRNAQFLTTS